MLEPKRIKAVLFHPLSQGLGVSSLSLGVLLWLPGFDPTPASAGDPLQVLVERCADVPNRSIVIDEGQLQALLKLQPGANQDVIQIVGQTSFCGLSTRLFYGEVVTPQAFPLRGSTKVALILYNKNNSFVGVEQWELPQTQTTHQVFAQNWGDRYGQVNPVPQFLSNSGDRPILSMLADIFFGPSQSKAAPTPPSYAPVSASNSSTCQ